MATSLPFFLLSPAINLSLLQTPSPWFGLTVHQAHEFVFSSSMILMVYSAAAAAAAAAAAKSLQSCPTLCDPIDGRPRVSPVPGILQARILGWVAISFSIAGK